MSVSPEWNKGGAGTKWICHVQIPYEKYWSYTNLNLRNKSFYSHIFFFFILFFFIPFLIFLVFLHHVYNNPQISERLPNHLSIWMYYRLNFRHVNILKYLNIRKHRATSWLLEETVIYWILSTSIIYLKECFYLYIYFWGFIFPLVTEWSILT